MELFGSGLMWATPLTNSAGVAVANPTPLLFGTMQDTEVDISGEIKSLYGQNQFPVAVGRGKGAVKGKSKFASIYGGHFETLIFGQAGSSGIIADVYDTTGAAIPTTPYQVTVAPPSSGTWSRDLGVISAATGRPMARVSSAPATGQYSVAAGVYTFAAADTALVMYINYAYTASSTVARKGTVVNQPMGYAPTFRCDLYMPFNGKFMVFSFRNCVADGIKVSGKNDDFNVPELNFQAFADVGGNVFDWSLSE